MQILHFLLLVRPISLCYSRKERRIHMTKLHNWTDYMIRKGIFLSALLLTAALILSVWESAEPASFPLLYQYSRYCVTSSVTVLAASLFGGIFLEDIFLSNGK